MIAADDKLMTYPEAALFLGCRAATEHGRRSFISKLVASGDLIVTDYGHRTKRISTLDALKFRQSKRALEKTTRTTTRRK